MKTENSNCIITKIAGTKHHTFNVPEIGDRVILVHNKDNNIIVFNSLLQQIGHLTKLAGFNKIIGELIDWKPYIAKVVAIYPMFEEIVIEIHHPTITIEVNRF